MGLGALVATATPSGADEPARAAVAEVRAPDGRTLSLRAPERGAVAVVFYSTECPISNAYSPTLNAISDEFPRRSLNLVGLCVDPDLPDAGVAAHAREYRLKFPVASDRRGVLAGRLGANVTPEAVVLDDAGKVRYRGRIDDQFAARQKRNAHPKTHELRDAIAAVLAAREVAEPCVAAVGCPLPEVPKGAADVSYSRDVAPILQKNCQECHRKGQVGPFALETYPQARKRAADIAAVVEARKMPPWKPSPGVGPRLKHDRSLKPEEIATLVSWADAGAPEGDPADLPPPPKFRDDWALGTPDLVLEPDEDFAVPAEFKDKDGRPADIYRCFVIKNPWPEDVYISAIEYRPGNRKVVHHVLSYVDTSGQGRKRDQADPGPGYACSGGPGVEVHGDLGGWAPGNEPSRLPEGIGRFLPRGSDVVMQVHYHPDGKPQTDRTRIGLYFCKAKVKQTYHWNFAAAFEMEIPPGAPNHEVRAEPWEVPVDLVAYAVTPHMHMLGKDISMFVTYPDGRTVDLVKIDDWDFGWQNTYYFEEPIDLPRGSKLHVVSHFDNSKDNPRNPNREPKAMRWGEATTDEMCIGFIGVTKKGQDLRLGEADDLRDVFSQQSRPDLERLKKRAKERAEKAKAQKKAE
jgi:mono/diheme cytochrome c family protein